MKKDSKLERHERGKAMFLNSHFCFRFRHPDQVRSRADGRRVHDWGESAKFQNRNKNTKKPGGDSLYQNIEQIDRLEDYRRAYSFVNRLKPLTRSDLNSNIYRPNENLSAIELGLTPHSVNKSPNYSGNPGNRTQQWKNSHLIYNENLPNPEKKVWFGYSGTQEPRILSTSMLNYESRMLDEKKLRPQQVLVENINMPPLITFNHLGVI